jgi:hypothetical protein
MARKTIKQRMKLALEKVNKDVAEFSEQNRTAGLVSEGYDGGYRDALSDAILLLNGVVPRRNNWWLEDESTKTR